MRRRKFLRHILGAPLAASAFLYGNPFGPGLRFAHAATGKTFVVIFNRGGCDGLNTVIPYRDLDYYKLRPNIAIRKPGSGSGASLNLDGFFGLHPALAPLHKIYTRGDVAVLPAVQYKNASRSHFDGQKIIESGVAQTARSNGWFNRHLSNFPQSGNIRAASFGHLSHTLSGSARVSTIDNLSDFIDADPQANNIQQSLRQVFNQGTNAKDSNRRLLHRHGRFMLDDLDEISTVMSGTYTPANKAVYPTGNYGLQMMQLARLIKAGVGLEAATVSLGGWDTHANQGGVSGRLANNQAEFAAGVAALYQDLGSGLMNDVIILSMTEFGRTALQNASGGTDHGHASSWFVIGSSVNGGIYGIWPGLQPNDLLAGRYLNHSTDYRDIIGEIIINHLGNTDTNTILPNHSYQPVGFL